MVEISIEFPLNTSFLSETLYEGLLYLIYSSDVKEVVYGKIMLENAEKSLKTLEDSRLKEIKIQLTTNDFLIKPSKKRKPPINKFLETLSIKVVSKYVDYGSLLEILKENVDKIVFKNRVDLTINMDNNMFIDVKSKSEGIALPQIFKVDRYTGFSSIEKKLMSKQITAYISKEVLIILLLGLYSSYVERFIPSLQIGKRKKGIETFFFLTLAPEEVLRALMSKNVEALRRHVRTLFIIKDLAKQAIGETVRRTSLNEALATELALNLKLREALKEHNLDKIALTLFKIAYERRTYKIYEQTPITIYRIPPYIHTLGKFFRDPDEFAGKIAEELTPRGAIMRALGNPEADEHEDIVEAAIGLYRFVVLGDAAGWYVFTRKLMDAHNKVKDRTNVYARILSRLSY